MDFIIEFTSPPLLVPSIWLKEGSGGILLVDNANITRSGGMNNPKRNRRGPC